MTTLQPNPEAQPDSPYAAELQKEPPASRFAPLLEAQYRRASLQSSRTLVRVACTLTLVLLSLRGLEILIGLNAARIPPFLEAVVVAATLVLTWLAWSAHYERLFLPLAQVLVPIRNALIAVQVVHVAAGGQLDSLMVLPLLLVGPFYFLGLPFRTALFAATSTTACALGAGAVFGLPPSVLVRGGSLLVTTLITFALAALQLEKRARRAFLESGLVAELAQRDVLTWTKNRRMFDEALMRLWRQASGDGRALAILLIDVDYFKAYNDCCGHQAGDAALRRAAQAIERCARRSLDLVARYGGEEFGVILYDTDASAATAIAEKMRETVEKLAIEHRASRCSAVLTISVGVAALEPTAWRNPYGALQLADEALYRAKSKGRNRVELMDDVEHRLLVTGEFSKDIVQALRRDSARS